MAEKCSCAHVPTVIVPGIGQSQTALFNKDGEIERIVWPFSGFDVKAVIKAIAPNALAAMVTRQDAGLPQKLAKAVAEQLDVLFNNPDGTPLYDVRALAYPGSLADCSEEQRRYIYRMVPVPTLEDKIGRDHLWFFTYNSFGETMKIVDDLRAYIQVVKEKTGHDKVNLAPISLGGTVAAAYLGKYGDDNDINRVVAIVPAYDGTQAIADMIADRLDYENYREVVSFLFRSSVCETIDRYLRLFSEKTAFHTLKAVLHAVIDGAVKNCVTLWGAVPCAEYPALSLKYLSDEKHKKLKEQADEVYRYRRDFAQTVKREQKKGVIFDTICCHGLRIFEFCKSDRLDSDHIVHSASASMGATFAPLGKKLPAFGVCPNGHTHASPDGTVDASTGLAPDTTWYFANQAHDFVQNCRPVLETAEWLLADEEYKDVFTDPAHPQFTTIDHPSEER